MNTRAEHLPDVLGPVRQLGHVVEDIRGSIEAWQADGVGPWLWMRNVRLKCRYKGKPSRPLIDVALSYRGDMQIELIQQHNDDPSPYRQTRDSGAFGLHHQAFLCDNIHQSVQQAELQGLQILCDIRMFGSRYVYLQPRPDEDAGFIELLPASWMMKALFRCGIAASERWQGQGEPTMVDLKNAATLMRSLPAAARAWPGR